MLREEPSKFKQIEQRKQMIDENGAKFPSALVTNFGHICSLLTILLQIYLKSSHNATYANCYIYSCGIIAFLYHADYVKLTGRCSNNQSIRYYLRQDFPLKAGCRNSLVAIEDNFYLFYIMKLCLLL